jgi:hypothetical protein
MARKSAAEPEIAPKEEEPLIDKRRDEGKLTSVKRPMPVRTYREK